MTNQTAAVDQIVWALSVVRQGDTPGTLSLGDNTNLYTPEVNCLTYGIHEMQVAATQIAITDMGSTKTMRKMMGGDILVLSMQGKNATAKGLLACIQFFCKT